MIAILWHERESNKYTDLIPDAWFIDEGSIENCTHEVSGPKKGKYQAKCNVKVAGSVAYLDYESSSEFNTKNNMYLGVMKLKFESKNREKIAQIFWKDEGANDFLPVSTTVSVVFDPAHALDDEVAASKLLSLEDRQKKLALAPKKPRKIQITRIEYRRNPDVIAEILIRANGVCQQCDEPAPFMKSRNGEPYLEVHHRVRLADGGDDTVDNAIALCPNCHRESHYG